MYDLDNAINEVTDSIEAEKNKDGGQDYVIKALENFRENLRKEKFPTDSAIESLYRDLTVWTPIGVLHDDAVADELLDKILP
jgi:hypothetical protein